MAPFKPKGKPPANLYIAPPSAPLPALVVSTKAFVGISPRDQLGAFAATVTRSLDAAFERLSDGPPIIPLRDCLEESGLLCTMRGSLLAKFTVVNPTVLASLQKLTDTSPLLPVQQPNPGFGDFRLSWDNYEAKYYRCLVGVPRHVSVEALVAYINQSLPCTYVGRSISATGHVTEGSHIVAFTVASATDLPVEIPLPAQPRQHRRLTIRVINVPSLDASLADALSKNPSQWEADPSYQPGLTKPAWGRAVTPSSAPPPPPPPPRAAPVPAASAHGKGKRGKKPPKGMDIVTQRRVDAAIARHSALKAAEARATDAKTAAEAKAAAEKKAVADRVVAETRAYIRAFVDNIFNAVLAPERLEQRLEQRKRGHNSSEEEDTDDSDEELFDDDASAADPGKKLDKKAAKPIDKKAKDGSGDPGSSRSAVEAAEPMLE